MKKLALCALLVVSCFAELKVIENKPESRSGWFFGAGIGIGANAMQADASNPAELPYLNTKKTFSALVVSGKVGGVHYFTKMLGLRYYYNLDLNFNPAEIQGYEFYTLSGSHTINADAIVNVIASNNIEFAVVGGVGMGLLAGEWGPRYKTAYSPTTNNFVDFEFRFNLGARVMFDKKYGLEFMAKLPVTPTTTIFGGMTPGNSIKYSPYYFTLDFVMERF